MNVKMNLPKEVKEFFLRNCTMVETFGDDGKTEPRRYFYIPFWFGMRPESQDVVDVYSYSQMPEDLIAHINDQRGVLYVKPLSVEETRRRAGYFPEFPPKGPNMHWSGDRYRIAKHHGRE